MIRENKSWLKGVWKILSVRNLAGKSLKVSEIESRVQLMYSEKDRYYSPRYRSKIIALDKHTSTTVRDIATVVDVGKSSVSRILRTFQDS
ncbi:hypothetical protein TNCV_3757391 [Trichonephila clavipes]|nr:hypothetical protein TNCV_3757391 [Trichonephila clavipes]